ncbi:unnamed protein product [Sympodiomycopsis kandeliae]
MGSTSRSSSPTSDSGGLDMFAEPSDFRPKTPPPQILRVPYDFSGTASTSTLEPADQASSTASEKDLRIHLLGAHPLWGHHLWNASLDISRYLQSHADTLVKGKTILELGAAAGVPSIVCSREGAQKVVATDYPDQPLIDVLKKNLTENVKQSDVAIAQGYLWGSDPTESKHHLPEGKDGFDLLILSDLIFNHQAHPALLSSMDQCLSKQFTSASVPASQFQEEYRLVHDEANPLFPDQLPGGEFTSEAPTTPCVLVYYTSHRPHLAHKDMEFFTKAEQEGWVVERVGRWTRDPMFPTDAGSEIVRGTVNGFRLFRAQAK